jgi:hypothetical protein
MTLSVKPPVLPVRTSNRCPLGVVHGRDEPADDRCTAARRLQLTGNRAAGLSRFRAGIGHHHGMATSTACQDQHGEDEHGDSAQLRHASVLRVTEFIRASTTPEKQAAGCRLQARHLRSAGACRGSARAVESLITALRRYS